MSQSMQCNECAHYFGLFRCDAFPDEDIPHEIISGEFDHRKAFRGDHGVRFEALPNSPLANQKNDDAE